MNKVWIIHLEWVDDCDCADNTYCYGSKEKAYAAFDKLVHDEIVDCWGGVISEDGTIKDGYVFERNADGISIYEDGYYNSNHETITIKEYQIL